MSPVLHIVQILSKQRLIDQCTQEQSSKIYSTTKLKFYQNFYDFNCNTKAFSDVKRCSQNFIQGNEIFALKGNLPSSARHATFDALQ
jgi:hypothetical protein